MKKIKVLIYKLWYKVYCLCHKVPQVVGTDDTLNKLIEDNCSISRFKIIRCGIIDSSL